VFLKVPYPQLFDNRNITVKINKLFDNDFNTVWNTSLGHNITQIQNWDNLSEYSDYLNTSYEAYFNGTGVFCDPSNTLMQNGLGYKDVTNHKLWMKILHFSGLGPTIFYSGGNQSYLLNESPTHNFTNVDPFPPSLYVLCIDNDTADTMNATWSSNSSGSWVTFATNTSIANNTNITQTNLNFSSPGTKYWWRVNLTDGTNWYNQTYAFTTNCDPYQNGESPVNEVTKASTTPLLYVVCNDNDTADSMTAYWYYNDSSTGKWYLFGTNSSVSSGTNITQDNSNFSNHSTTYYWSVNLTDGNNWSNITYSFTTNYAPTQTGKAPTSGSNYVNTTPDLYVIVTDLDSDTMTAHWWYNVSDSWWQFATNSSITSGTNITQTNSNFSNNSETCYWSVNVTDGTNWTNSTNSFTTRSQYLPDPPTSFTATAAGTSSISLSWTIGTNSNYTRIQRGTSTYPTSISSGTGVYNSTGSSKTDSGLSSGTKYYYSAWSYNYTGCEWSVTYATASATTSSPSGGSPGSPPAPPTVDDDDDTTDDDTTTTTTSDDNIDSVNDDYGLSLEEAFYATDSDEDGTVDSFTDPNGQLTAIDNLDIENKNSFLVSTDDDEIPEFFWNAEDDTITEINHAVGTVSDTQTDTEQETITLTVDITKTDWVYIDVADEYPEYAVVIKTPSGQTISSERIWRKNNKIYVLDDPAQSYEFIYSYAILLPSFTPATGQTFNTSRPNITITFQEEVNITTALFGTHNILDQITTTDNITFTYQSNVNLSNGNYILNITAQDNESNNLTVTSTYTINVPSEGPVDQPPDKTEETLELPFWLIIIIIVLIIITIIGILFKTGYLYIEEDEPSVKKEEKPKKQNQKKKKTKK
jgi:hypothetical protein